MTMSTLLIRAYTAVMLALLTFPIFLVIPMSFSATRYLQFPPEEYSLRWYQFLWESAAWQEAALRSLGISAAATLIALPIGTLAALGVSRSSGATGRIVTMLSLGPQIVPAVIVALGALLVSAGLGLYGNPLALVLVHACLGIPFVLLVVTPVLREGSEQYMRAARSLGAGFWRAVFTVVLPQIMPALFASAVFVFFISFDELVIALFLMGGTETLPMRIWSDLRNELTPAVAAVSTILILVTLAAIIPAEIYRNKKRRAP
ncbi:hypothetical protein A8B76_00530 [Roseovarius indicus]|nr:hypothetical protein A8B76_00530 [Roseovarius indicus]